VDDSDTEAPDAGVRLVLVGRPGCHLCDEAREVVARVAEELDVGWQERSLVDDPALLSAYAELVPVVLVDGEIHAYWRVEEQALRAALTAPRPGSRWLRRWLR
jgi:hypothetical protein